MATTAVHPSGQLGYVQGVGKEPVPFDLLYWNADATNLPGPMYSYYLRNTYADNRLCKPDALKMLGEIGSVERIPEFIKRSKDPTTFVGSDHGFGAQWYAVNAGKVTLVRSTGSPIREAEMIDAPAN